MTQQVVLNTLGDLTKRENRYGHQPFVFPHDARFWGMLGMPTLQECSFYEDTQDLTTGLWPFPLQTGTTNDVSVITVGGRSFDLILPAQAYDGMSEEYMPLPSPLIASGAGGVVPGYANEYMAEEFRLAETLDDGFDPWFNPIPWHDVDPSNATLKAYDLGAAGATRYYPNATGFAGSTRVAEDVVLTNVLAFDIKVWDPGAPVLEHRTSAGTLVSVLPSDPGYFDYLGLGLALSPTYPTPPTAGNTFIASYGAYVDLNYMCRTLPDATGLSPIYNPSNPLFPVLRDTGAPEPWFHGPGDPRSQLMSTLPAANPTIANARAAVYDTWSTHYEYDGINQDGDNITDEGTDGFDNPVSSSPYQHDASTAAGENGIDDFNELEAPPPYAFPLKGVQITIRVFEPDSRQIREVTIVQDFQAAASGNNYE